MISILGRGRDRAASVPRPFFNLLPAKADEMLAVLCGLPRLMREIRV